MLSAGGARGRQKTLVTEPSQAHITSIIMPKDENPNGGLFGGRIMDLMVEAGWVAATRHASTAMAIGRLDGLQFVAPGKVGDLVVVNACATTATDRSVEVDVLVTTEAASGEERECARAVLTYRPLGVREDPAAPERERWRPGPDVTSIQHRSTPCDADAGGWVSAGPLLALIDLTAGACARRYARPKGPGVGVATAAVDVVEFRAPVSVGSVCIVQARCAYASSRSMEVDVRVFAEDAVHGAVRFACSARLLFIALGEDGRASRLPPLAPQSEGQARRIAAGQLRYEARKAARNP
jgi:acyl-CoA hydrolase